MSKHKKLKYYTDIIKTDFYLTFFIKTSYVYILFNIKYILVNKNA